MIFAAGTGNPFFTTDTTAALRAVELGADALLKASKVDGIYDADPATHPDAKRLDELSYMDFISDELRVMDTTAVTMSKEHGVPIVVFDMTTPGNIVKAVSGEKIGTVIHRRGGTVISDLLTEAEHKMEQATDHVASEFSTVRTGRATPSFSNG